MKTNEWYYRMQQAEVEQFTEIEFFERLIYESIKSYSGNAKLDVVLSVRQIAARATISYSTVSRFLPKLIAKGMIKIVGTKNRIGGPVNIYKVLLPATVSVATGNALDKKSVAVSKESVAVSKESVAGVASTPLQPNNLKPNTQKSLCTEKTITEKKSKDSGVSKDHEDSKNSKESKDPKSRGVYLQSVIAFNQKYSTNLFPTMGKQTISIKRILSGYSEAEMWACADWLSKDTFWKQKGFDFSTILSQMAKWKVSQSQRKEAHGYVNAKDIDTTNF